jgi:DNA-binding MarR family transcriptional regulator
MIVTLLARVFLQNAWINDKYGDCMPAAIGEDYRGPDGRLGYLMRQAQQALWIALEAELRPLGISASQFGVLRLVEVEPGATGADLAYTSMFSPQSTQEILVVLESAGLIERRFDDRDGRIRRTFLTKEGARILKNAHVRAIALEERMVVGLSRRQSQDFKNALVHVAQALVDDGNGVTK